ncbi:MAG: hypothetical protein AAFX78_00165 [Cyanobacteria bacterium J06638_20]
MSVVDRLNAQGMGSFLEMRVYQSCDRGKVFPYFTDTVSHAWLDE